VREHFGYRLERRKKALTLSGEGDPNTQVRQKEAKEHRGKCHFAFFFSSLNKVTVFSGSSGRPVIS
jgi:hypothetical protein